jgi:hypothetical protein
VSLATKAKQIKTTQRFTASDPSQNGYHQEHKQQQMLRMQEKEILIYGRWECKLVHPLWKSVWRVLKRKKNGTTV